MSNPSLPKGTRDFAPDVMLKRQFIFQTIRTVFQRYGFLPLETPAMENLETLTGKYGEEGDQLVFKILNNGDYLKDVDDQLLTTREVKKLTPKLCDRALRYDLTVPFARFVAMNQHQIAFPFRRYQIQPVWRADRPQKGRYREFYQCDADIIGSESLICEVELIQLFDEALSALGFPSFSIRINNRKILAGLAEIAGVADRMMEMTIAIDKLDKVGLDGVTSELAGRGFSNEAMDVITGFFGLPQPLDEKLTAMRWMFSQSAIGLIGITELEAIFKRISVLGLRNARLELDVTLARGLNYYTGAILEVKADHVQMGSIGGGGRYDDLTGIFGLPGMSGVGISFGADRIYDVMNELSLFPQTVGKDTRLLLARFSDSEAEELALLTLLKQLRDSGLTVEIYPDVAKLKKQFKYADDRGIPFVLVMGEDERKAGKVSLKNMKSGIQNTVDQSEVAGLVSDDRI